MSIFDGSVAGTPPTSAAGKQALAAALRGDPFEAGPVGAGAGATTGKWRQRLDPGGLGLARGSAGPASVMAIVVVNAWGDVIGSDGRPVFESGAAEPSPDKPFGLNTTVGVLLTDARLGKDDCFLLAQSGHTGYARAIHPAHSRYDGDAVVALATGEVAGADLDLLRAVATETMASAIRNAISHA
jgi:L-aminopeptidase/D-esterase-like protein